MARKVKVPQNLPGPFDVQAGPDPEPEQEQPVGIDKPGDMERRATKAATAAVMPGYSPPRDERNLYDMIAPVQAAITDEMNSRRSIAADLRDKEHEQTIVAAKLQNEKDLKAMELDAMLKRMRMEQDANQGIKRFGPNKYGV